VNRETRYGCTLKKNIPGSCPDWQNTPEKGRRLFLFSGAQEGDFSGQKQAGERRDPVTGCRHDPYFSGVRVKKQ
jgi:hypothetical protein